MILASGLSNSRETDPFSAGPLPVSSLLPAKRLGFCGQSRWKCLPPHMKHPADGYPLPLAPLAPPFLPPLAELQAKASDDAPIRVQTRKKATLEERRQEALACRKDKMVAEIRRAVRANEDARVREWQEFARRPPPPPVRGRSTRHRSA